MTRHEVAVVCFLVAALVAWTLGHVLDRENSQTTIDQSFDDRCHRAGGAVVPGIEPGIIYCAQLVKKLEPK